MKKLYSMMLITTVCAGVLIAQQPERDKPQQPQERVQRVVTIKHGNLAGILRTLRELGVSISSSDNEHIIVSGTKDAVAGYEEIIKELDVPPVVKKDVELTAYMLAAGSQLPAGAAVPSELDPVVKQLRTVFNYKGFLLLDSFALRSRDGERGDNSGTIAALDSSPQSGSAKIYYTFHYNRVTIDGGESGKVIRFDGLKLNLRVPVGGVALSYTETGIATDVDVPEGKKVVVGKSSGVGGSDSALILVISAKVVD